MARYVLIPKFCELTGYTEEAVRAKIRDGVWLEDREYKKAPDRHVVRPSRCLRTLKIVTRIVTQQSQMTIYRRHKPVTTTS